MAALHLKGPAEYSYIEVNHLRALYREACGPQKPMPAFDVNTLVQLQWKYPAFEEVQVTFHRVLRDSRFPVILRRQDWEPVLRLWLQTEHADQLQRQEGQQNRGRGQKRQHAPLNSSLNETHTQHQTPRLSKKPRYANEEDDMQTEYERSDPEGPDGDSADENAQSESDEDETFTSDYGGERMLNCQTEGGVPMTVSYPI